MISKKRLLLIGLMAILAMLFVACGGGDADNSNEGGAGENTAGQEEGGEEMEEGGEEMEEGGEEMAEGETVTINIYAGDERDREYTAWIEESYEADHPNVDIVFVDAGNVVEDRLGVYLQIFEAQSDEMDIAQIDVIWPGDLAEHFVDLNE